MVPRSVSFVFIESPWVKYEELFGSAFERLGVHCEFYPLPALPLDQRTLRNIRAIMRLPPQVDWDSVAIRIPYTSLSRLHAIVKSDYDSKSTTQFMERQKLALATSERLIAAEWLDQVLKNCIMGTLR